MKRVVTILLGVVGCIACKPLEIKVLPVPFPKDSFSIYNDWAIGVDEIGNTPVQVGNISDSIWTYSPWNGVLTGNQMSIRKKLNK